MKRRIYKNAAEKQKAYRGREIERRAAAIRKWFSPADQIKRLAREVDWLKKLLRDVQIAQETRRLASIGQRLEEQQKTILAKNNALADRVAELEREKHIRERNRDRRQKRRQAGIILPSDPPAIRDRYAPDPPVFVQPRKVAPVTPVEHVAPVTPMPRPISGEDDWRPYVSIPRSATPAPGPALDKQTATLISKIKANGYQVNASNGTVLYDNRWIPAEEWVRRMPGILD